MSDISRRSLLVGTAAAGAALAGTNTGLPPANAAAPAAGKQNAGWYRYNVGSAEITVVTDGKNTFKLPDNFVVNVSKDAVNEALAAARMEKDNYVYTHRGEYRYEARRHRHRHGRGEF